MDLGKSKCWCLRPNLNAIIIKLRLKKRFNFLFIFVEKSNFEIIKLIIMFGIEIFYLDMI